MIVIAYGQDGRIVKVTDVVVIRKHNDNYIYLYDKNGVMLRELVIDWIVKLEVL